MEGGRRGFLAMAGASSALFLATGQSTATSSAGTTVDFVSVKDFGAVGDGLVDDTSSLQSAIDSVVASGRGLLFPDGTYRVTNTLVHAGGPLCLSGLGSAARVVLQKEGNGDLLQSESSLVVDGVFFRHLGDSGSCLLLAGDGVRAQACTFQNTIANSSQMVRMYRSNQSVKDCYFENNCPDALSILVERSSLGMTINGSIESCRFYGMGKGLQISSTVPAARPEGWLVSANKFVTTGDEAIVVYAGLQIALTSNVIDQAGIHAIGLSPIDVGIEGASITDNYIATPQNASAGVGIQTLYGSGPIRGLKVAGNHFEHCGHGIVLGERALFSTISSNSFDHIGDASIYSSASGSVSITGNVFRGTAIHLAIQGACGPHSICSNVFDELGGILYSPTSRDQIEFSANSGIKLSGWTSEIVSTAAGGTEAYISIPHGLPAVPNPSKTSVSVIQLTGGHLNVSSIIHGATESHVLVQLFFQIAVRGSLKVNLFSSL